MQDQIPKAYTEGSCYVSELWLTGELQWLKKKKKKRQINAINACFNYLVACRTGC